jgi:hypothetical protein
MSLEKKLQNLAASIKEKRAALDEESKRLRTPAIQKNFNKYNHDSWCQAATGDALIKLRLFTEQNFNFLETMGTISVTRYTFELSIWLRLFDIDSRYGLVYASQLIETQRRFWLDQKSQLEREIHLLKNFSIEESELIDRETERLTSMSNTQQAQAEAATLYKRVTETIDAKAARKFSIYADQAKDNGYESVATFIQKRVLPDIENSIVEIEQEKIEFRSKLSEDIRKLIPGHWNWRTMAKTVKMEDEYDYIYTFTSKLLHATPASLTTNQKNLELHEMIVFLKFVDIQILDAIELAKKY